MRSVREDELAARPETERVSELIGLFYDAAAQSYFPTLFGRGGYVIVGNIKRLPAALPALYRQVTQ